MRFTRDELPRATRELLSELQTLISSERSYARYRDILSRTTLPSIPFLGIYLSDLTFIEDGQPDSIDVSQLSNAGQESNPLSDKVDLKSSNKPVELINVSKRSKIYNIIAQIQEFQGVGYNFTVKLTSGFYYCFFFFLVSSVRIKRKRREIIKGNKNNNAKIFLPFLLIRISKIPSFFFFFFFLNYYCVAEKSHCPIGGG